jgi:hypothetical protein
MQLRLGPGGGLYVILPNTSTTQQRAAPSNPAVIDETSSRPQSQPTMHECNCGPTCQCVGCISHPFNRATRDYVRSAYEDISFSPDLRASSSTGYCTAGNESSPVGISDAQINVDSAAGEVEHEVSLPPDDFFYVNYRISGELCLENTEICPCDNNNEDAAR